MSNTLNLRHRKRMITLAGRVCQGGESRGDCMRPGRGASKEDLLEWHKERVRNRMGARRRSTRLTSLQWKVAELRKKSPAHLRAALANFSRTPKGVKRSLAPIYEGVALY